MTLGFLSQRGSMHGSQFMFAVCACLSLPAIATDDTVKYYQVLADKCVGIVKARLHDPTDAQLPSALSVMDYPGKFYIGNNKKGAITVQFEIRARNGFNAMRRSIAECQWRRDKDGYALIGVTSF